MVIGHSTGTTHCTRFSSPLQFSTHNVRSYLQLIQIYCMQLKNGRNTDSHGFILFCHIIYNLSFNVFRDIRKKHKAWKDVAEIVGAFSEWT